MTTDGLRRIWAEGGAVLNGWCSIGSPFTAEILSAQGYDSVTIDLQHGALDYCDALPMLQAMRASGAALMTRVAWRDPARIMKVLDAGAMGVICPMINTSAEAADFVSCMRYPPRGQRSFGPTRAAFAMPGYGTHVNDAVLAFAMIETADGLANLEEIAATPGLEGIYVGPADLTLGTQGGRLKPGLDREESEMIALIQHIAETCNRHGIVPGIHCGTPEYAARAIGWGYRLVTVANDVRLLARAAADSVRSFRSLTGGEGGGQESPY